MENFDDEIWKDIPDYTGLYQASNLGRIRSLDRYIMRYGHFRLIKGVVIKQRLQSNYYTVGLYKNGMVKRVLVHRVVWETFNGAIPKGMEINHIDENTSNNALSNLSLLTHKENMNWGTRTNRSIENRVGKTARKVVLQYDLNGNLIKEWESLRDIEKECGYFHTNICRCCKHQRKTSNGYIWKYAKEGD